ncbi:hypothetical protein Ddye_020295 [Dipteronia dyeriana]|uniref:Uncharacterized protein n=1 Tax=Dipteronia dyeriana TaxID=168575 RepID=A0AAD9U0J2_9ROSI|nr:hypothetical protein Ddye_020295 [Dipteronia dyeriana]
MVEKHHIQQSVGKDRKIERTSTEVSKTQLTEIIPSMPNLYRCYLMCKDNVFGQKINYSIYLKVFPCPNIIHRQRKITREYRVSIETLFEALENFDQCLEPLQDLDFVIKEVIADFQDTWDTGTLTG